MMLKVQNLLPKEPRNQLAAILAAAGFVDGRQTAGKIASQVKKNQELALSPEQQHGVNRIIMSTVAQNAQFRSFVLPNRMADFIIARYEPGMTYGDHVDDPIMGAGGSRFRTDVSMTIFLNEPEAYEGGELQIRTPFGTQSVKLGAGDAVIYPSSSLHQVAPVISGQRLVALTWIQSFVRDAARRELLFELDQTREHLQKNEPELETTKALDRSYANLLRMWADV